MHFAPCWAAPPAIVAEELIAVSDPLLTALRAGPAAGGAAVAASLARSMSPAEDCAPPAPWLLPGQLRSFRQALAAVQRYRGAVLADPVGSGKTYVALAVAAAFKCEPTACIVPATLVSQWEAAGKELGIRLALGSHEQASRGRLPQGSRGLVIVDESHHFRNRLTRRYRNLATWLVGRPALLVTATPIVNGLSDLGNQLHLSLRDNALAIEGIPSLRALLMSGCPHAALGQVVVENDAVIDARPRRISKVSAASPGECGTLGGTVELLGRLRLSHNESIAGLIRRVLLRGAASSPAALAGALQRYHRLLLHARDALRVGRALECTELRRFTADLEDQLVWWELLPCDHGSSDLALADLAELEKVIPAATTAMREADPKLNRLREILSDEKPALVFTTSRDTVRYIRERLGDPRLAWCTGDQAGISRTLLSRPSVLAWFREGGPAGPGPKHLVVTDVAAEGLDLQRAGRIVHYDLPWTPMRLEQREGRAVRLGSRHSEVEVVRFVPPASLEGWLRLEETLARKERLLPAAGLGPGGRHIWRWRAELAQRFGSAEPVAGVASVSSPLSGLLAGFALYRSTDPGWCLSATVGWLDMNGGWTEESEVVGERLMAATGQRREEMADAHQLRKQLELLAPVIRDRLGLTRARRWISPDPSPATRNVAKRLGGLIQAAARRRQEGRLLQLEKALAFVAGGHSAGEEVLVERLADAPDGEILTALSRVIPQTCWDGIEVRLTGLIVFGPAA
ncbi:MAG: DEAD/DEAH box helicase [Gemmatimonadota bacterium]|nr:DEAD/DEAH box helicase [Gemmatimonadota bacterium]